MPGASWSAELDAAFGNPAEPAAPVGSAARAEPAGATAGEAASGEPGASPLGRAEPSPSQQPSAASTPRVVAEWRGSGRPWSEEEPFRLHVRAPARRRRGLRLEGELRLHWKADALRGAYVCTFRGQALEPTLPLRLREVLLRGTLRTPRGEVLSGWVRIPRGAREAELELR